MPSSTGGASGTAPVPVGPDSALPAHLDPHGRRRGRGLWGWGHGTRLITKVLSAVLSATLLVLAGYVWLTFRSLNEHLNRLHVTVGQPPVVHHPQPFNGKDQNILLVGNDDRATMTNAEVRQYHVGRDGGSLNTDVMMIVHVPADGSQATLISLPRDSYVKIPGYSPNRLNVAYADAYNNTRGSLDDKRSAGANLLIKTISNLTGLTINHYVQVDFLGFVRISTALGGVPINLCHATNDPYSGFKMSAGRHVIQGITALEFVRQRHGLPNSDLDRVRRQQYFLTSAFRQVASAGILFKLNALSTAIRQSFYFDPSLNLVDLARQVENLTANNISGKTIPTSPAVINGADVLLVHPAQVQRFLAHVLTKSATSPKKPKPSHGRKKHTDKACIN